MDYNSMNSNDDELDSTNNNQPSNSNHDRNTNTNSSSNMNGMSKAELRKSNKPIMEKRRRARINHCLNELKTLILEAMKKDPARHTKLEKADILEMTVKHLQSIQRQQLSLAIQTDPAVIHKFKTGFSECAEEVTRYLNQLDSIDLPTRQRLIHHLNSCASRIEQIGTFSNFSSTYRTALTTGLTHSIFGNALNSSTPLFPSTPQDVNNNGRINMNGVQLIPSRLPSGELALIMPNSNTLPSSILMPNIQQQPIEFSSTFPRLSAFSKPGTAGSPVINNNNHNNNNTQRPSATQTTASIATSPPLSPVSSISSLGDDSMMHTSSDYSSKTPPLEQSITSDYFSTPPSAESIKYLSRTSHLQQPHVSSTSESLRNQNDSNKRLRQEETVEDSPVRKLIKLETDEDEKNGNHKSLMEDSNDSMWRPW